MTWFLYDAIFTGKDFGTDLGFNTFIIANFPLELELLSTTTFPRPFQFLYF